jgi:hypothetical protein
MWNAKAVVQLEQRGYGLRAIQSKFGCRLMTHLEVSGANSASLAWEYFRMSRTVFIGIVRPSDLGAHDTRFVVRDFEAGGCLSLPDTYSRRL